MQTLKTKKEFDFVYKNGFLRYGRDFAIYVYKENPQHFFQSKNLKNALPQKETFPQNATFSKENSGHSEYNKPKKSNDFRESKAIAKSMESKIGLSVSKKIGNAVARNKIKRSVRAILRECRQNDFREIENGFRIIFVAKVGINALSFAELKHSFESTLRFSLDRLSYHKLSHKHHTQRTQKTIQKKGSFQKVYDKKYDKTNTK